ncbi:kinase-like domain-containing protein [Aspergillus pseudoustus]|uniref:Kinase-like domain-containing protein n=1 Tax=Aspergillus pseudoustus TaxID=1810923 RepID=A0ABR4JF36_9EURO
MEFDDIQLAAYDKVKIEWIKRVSQSSAGIVALVNQYRQKDDCLLRSMHCGSFNFSIRLHWDDGQGDWLIRFPIPGKSMYLDEKVQREAAVMKYVAKETNIPIPAVIAYGSSAENPTGLGPFIIMKWIEGRKMSELLREESDDPKESVLDPTLDPTVLKTLYGQMADILLELWKLDFEKIGSLSIGSEPIIDGPPLTLETNELIRTSGLNGCAPQRMYDSSMDYLASLLQLQDTHLDQQRNSVYDSEDYRQKYACRHLMKAIALQFIANDERGPFKLFSDDLGPGNVLVNDSLEVVAVIDWEFCYAAPPQFSSSIPWWLLLQQPYVLLNELGPDAFLDAFIPKANIFLQVLEEREISREIAQKSVRLSSHMRRSLEDRSAWFMLACRMTGSVDLIYWDLLDEFCWGTRASVAERVYTLTSTPEMHEGREDLVRLKMRQLQEYYEDLGEGSDVAYEPEQFQGPNVKIERSYHMDRATNQRFLEGVLAGLTIGVGASLLVRWYRS